jgi:PPP family 3-phenylpropionic acid transporter
MDADAASGLQAASGTETIARGLRVPISLFVLMVVQHAVGGAILPFVSLVLADRGLSVVEVSRVTAAMAAASCVFPFLWGWAADRVLSLNRLIPLLHLAGAAVLLAASGVWSFAGLAGCFALFSGLQQPTYALVSALVYHNLPAPARQFGRLRAWGSVGWMLPSVPVYLWLARTGTDDIGFVVYLAAGFQLLFVVLSPCFPHTPPPGRSAARRAAGEAPPGLRYSADLRLLVRSPGFVLLLVCSYFVVASFSIMLYFSAPRLEAGGIARRWIGLVLSLSVACEVPLFLVLPAVLRRFGYLPALLAGVVCALLRQVVFFRSSSTVVLVAGSLLLAPAVVFFLIASSLVANAVAPERVRATAQTCLALVAGAGSVTGLLAGGAVASGGDLRPAFAFGAVAAGAALAALPWVRLPERGPA